MTNNDILRQLRTALDLDDAEMVAIYKEAGFAMNPTTLPLLLKQEDEEGFIPCANQLLTFFLEGLIIRRRGRRDSTGGNTSQPGAALDNNTVLKKLRIALDLKEEDLLAIMNLAGMPTAKADLAPLFHAKGHRRYRECSDLFLQTFLRGIAGRR
ncbi:DUF1456 family protein [Geobacter sp. SVR]|uniref:DUF1456 family protein n=1 Tax=Geobacter sp. SVR TaxID=2495594 RepID=UPI00143EFA7C|nr:DUF1456 family protein [Geobacter sp. SVR]BCS55404.1 hypothetical protein GSVR_37120 [Geobacter sp. SVR]GCF83406.1 hypothetical protein GSbR_00060 [Geobacter sp. SVR]